MGKDLLDKREKKRARLERDADKPKRPQTAYWLWLGENRAALVKEAGTALGPVVAKLEAPFEKQAVAQKAEYDKALKEYKEKKGAEAEDEDEDDENDVEDQ